MSIEFQKKLVQVCYLRHYINFIKAVIFFSSVSCIPDTKKSLKIQNNPWHATRRTQRSINQNVRPVRIISVVVIVVVV